VNVTLRPSESRLPLWLLPHGPVPNLVCHYRKAICRVMMVAARKSRSAVGHPTAISFESQIAQTSTAVSASVHLLAS